MLEKLEQIIMEAGAVIRSARDAAQSVEEKTSPRDLVTKYDRQVQEFLREKLSALLPEAGFMGEEDPKEQDFSQYEWLFIVDPIDGTTNFIQGFHNSCVSVGLMHRGEMEYGLVYNPYDGELYTARRGAGAFLNGRRIRCADHDLAHSLLIVGTALYYRELTGRTLSILNKALPRVQDIRRFGSAALDLCYLAAGRAGVFYECRLCPWDYAAGALIAAEAGCQVTSLEGGALDYFHKCSVAAGSPTAYRQFMDLIADGEGACK